MGNEIILGQTKVKAKHPRKGWQLGLVVGRTYESQPRFDVLLEDRTVLHSLPADDFKLVMAA